MSLTLNLIRSLFVLAALAFLTSACTSTLKKSVAKDVERQRAGPEQRPVRAVSGFSDALRCMDDMFVDYGVERTKILVEDLEDRTKVVNAGTKDMLISAVSDMTKRSRAVELIAYGNDSGNLVAFLSAAGRQSQFQDVPRFDIRGSVSQLDKDIVTKQGDAALSFDKYGAGLGVSARGSILGLDLSVLNTESLAVVPGVVSRNSVLIFSSGIGTDADGTIDTAGISFSFSINKNDGQSQALRNLVELATIELMGRLFKLPYWNCLGIDPSHKDIKNEMSDWYYAMTSNRELVPYLQKQMAIRGYYAGPVDGTMSAPLRVAIGNYRADLGIGNDTELNESFWESFLNLHLKKQATTGPIGATASTIARRESDGDFHIATTNNSSTFLPGEKLNLVITTRTDGYVYCFYEDGNHAITRVFPNRFERNSLLNSHKELLLPGTSPFEMSASTEGRTEAVTCIRTSRDVMNELPDAVKVLDFVKLQVTNMNEIRESFTTLEGADVTSNTFEIKTR